MLAELRRRSSWRSLATARRLVRPLQLQASARPEDDTSEDVRGRLAEPASCKLQQHNAKSRSLNSQLLSALGEKEAGAVRQHVEKMWTDVDAGRFPALVGVGHLTDVDIERARESLRYMAKQLADPRAAAEHESRYQRAKRQLKAATGKLDRMLTAMQKRKDWKQVEAVAYLFEEEFPQFAGQRRHWRVICEHYALALNRQQRFQEVVDKFSPCFQEVAVGCESQGLVMLSPRLAESIFVATGHLREASTALQLLDVMQRHGVVVTKIAYFHVLNTLLRDERFTDFEKVMQLCEDIVTKLPGENVPLSLLPMIMMTAASRGEAERAMKFYSHPPDLPLGPCTEFYFEICLQQLNELEENEMLMEMYRNLMESSGASRDLKERVSKYLFRKKLAVVTPGTRNKQLGLACEILTIMNDHQIRVSHHAVFPLMRALLLDPVHYEDDMVEDQWRDDDVHTAVDSAKDLHAFFAQYSGALEWNAFALCEAIVAGVHAQRADLVDDLVVDGLDRGVPIKYAALEQVVVFYYRMGFITDLKRVADMVRALRLNKLIPLGIAVTEIGMAANLRLHRYEEVAVLFEDFASRDGERRRVLRRRFMLKSALTAYKRLGRSDEAQAIKILLDQSYSNLLESSSPSDEEEPFVATEDEADPGVEREANGLNERSEDENEASGSVRPEDLDMPSLQRFDH